ncbi:MAG: diacylglycerol kinase family protein [Pseudarcicella sp.]|nr:diacylglycerol kinase family protein [Pseudarcicella sp.]
MKDNKFSISKSLKSFAFAINGLKVLFKEEHNAKIHFVATIMVIIASVLFQLNAYEWMAIIFCIGTVLSAEIFNTVIENIADFLTIENNAKIKKIKDLSAAAVLITSFTAFIMGLIIFLPKIIQQFSKLTLQ